MNILKLIRELLDALQQSGWLSFKDDDPRYVFISAIKPLAKPRDIIRPSDIRNLTNGLTEALTKFSVSATSAQLIELKQVLNKFRDNYKEQPEELRYISSLLGIIEARWEGKKRAEQVSIVNKLFGSLRDHIAQDLDKYKYRVLLSMLPKGWQTKSKLLLAKHYSVADDFYSKMKNLFEHGPALSSDDIYAIMSALKGYIEALIANKEEISTRYLPSMIEFLNQQVLLSDQERMAYQDASAGGRARLLFNKFLETVSHTKDLPIPENLEKLKFPSEYNIFAYKNISKSYNGQKIFSDDRKFYAVSDGKFIYLHCDSGCTEHFKKQGWKLHISIYYEDIDKAWDIVKDIFIKYKIASAKVIRPELASDLRTHPVQRGVQMTIYYHYCPDLDWPQIIREIEIALKDGGIRPETFSPHNKSIKGSQYVTYRNSADREGKYVAAEDLSELVDSLKKADKRDHAPFNPFEDPDPFEKIDVSSVYGEQAQPDIKRAHPAA